MNLTKKEARHVFQRLRDGAVPEHGLEAFAVGIEKPRKEIKRLLEAAASGEGLVKFLRGGYGCGKTFMSNLAMLDAKAAGFATSFVVVSDNDLHFHKFDELYRKILSGLSTTACPRGALGDILDRWIAMQEEALIQLGVDENAPDFDERVLQKLDEHLNGLAGGKAPADMVRVIRAVFQLKQEGKLSEAAGLISWLSGSEHVPAGLKRVADIKGDISSTDALDYLRGIVEIIKSAGYKGLVIVIDEAETILRMRGDVRGKSLNGIRQIIDASPNYPGLLWVFTGTPDFFDTRRGVKGLEPLHDRIKFQEHNGVASLRQPQLKLEPFDEERLTKVAVKLRALHPDVSAEDMEQRFPQALIAKLVSEVTKGFRGDVGVVPRQFLRTYVDILDIMADDADQDPAALVGFTPGELTPQERKAISGEHAAVTDEDAEDFEGAGLEI